jgi:ABC-type branched-subunit amino acid transport system substrate-binding protein
MPLILCLALMLAVLGGCQTPTVLRGGVSVPVDAAIEADLNAARADLAAGRPEEARRRLEALSAEIPRGGRGDEVLFLLAETYVELEEMDQAIWTYRRVAERYRRGSWAPLAYLRLGELYRATGRPELARSVLARAPFDRADADVRVRLYGMLAELSLEAGNDPEALRWFAYARRDATDGEEIAEIDRQIDQLLREGLLDFELLRLSSEVPHGPVFDRLLLELTSRALDRGDADSAGAWLDRLPSRLGPEEEERREVLLLRLSQDVVGPGAPIGVAVPLSGPFQQYGWSALRGIMLALGTYDSPTSGFRVDVRDTAGDPEQTPRVVRELFSAGAVAVLGPLRSVTSAAAAPVATEIGAPMLALAQREDLPYLSPWVFRLGVTRSDQARVLARYAVERRGLRRFAILYPSDDYGVTYKNLFWDEVEQLGGEIVGVEAYPPDQVDVQTPIRRLVGMDYLTDDQKELVQERDRLQRRPHDNAERLASPELTDLPPFVDFDALFIPDAAHQVGLILPQVRFYDIRDPLLLGPSGWNDRKLVEIAGGDAEGVVFADVFFPASDFPFVKDFVSSYYAAYGEEPGAVAAEGFDAGSMLREALSHDDIVVSRTRVRDELLEIRDFPGVSGLTSFDEVGGTRKNLYLLTVLRGEIAEIGDLP